jgi:hypothetical protein
MCVQSLCDYHLWQSLLRKKLFVHFVLDPILISNSGTEASFAARYGCLVNIENVSFQNFGIKT